MKEKKSENLYTFLSEADDDILREAETTDNRSKLMIDVDTSRTSPVKRGSVKGYMKAAVIIAACLALSISALLIAPLFTKDPGSDIEGGSSDITNNNANVPGGIRIDSLHALNYYGAQVILAQQKTGNPLHTAQKRSLNPGFALLSEKELVVDGKCFPDNYDIIENDFPGDNEPKEEPQYEKIVIEEQQDIIDPVETIIQNYIDIDPNEIFTINAVYGFSIRITGEEGFLGQRLGTGLIDAVITRYDNGMSMITFHSRDGRFFSCMDGNYINNGMSFINHKYIEGFREYKRWDWTLIHFIVTMDDNIPTGVTTEYYETETLFETPLDKIEFVENSGTYTEASYTFTLSELEKTVTELMTANEALTAADFKKRYFNA